MRVVHGPRLRALLERHAREQVGDARLAPSWSRPGTPATPRRRRRGRGIWTFSSAEDQRLEGRQFGVLGPAFAAWSRRPRRQGLLTPACRGDAAAERVHRRRRPRAGALDLRPPGAVTPNSSGSPRRACSSSARTSRSRSARRRAPRPLGLWPDQTNRWTIGPYFRASARRPGPRHRHAAAALQGRGGYNERPGKVFHPGSYSVGRPATRAAPTCPADRPSALPRAAGR